MRRGTSTRLAVGRLPVRDERGFTLLELNVVLLLLGVVMAAVFAGFVSVQNTVSQNLSRQQTVQQAELAMQVVTKDLRATANDQNTNLPLISAMSLSSVTFAANIDTTSAANPVATGNASAYGGCPDQVTITGSATTPGPITQTRTHPDPLTPPSTVVAACTWTGKSTPKTRILATAATLSLSYLTYVDPTTGTAETSLAASTTAAVQVTITVQPSYNSAAVTPAVLVQTVQLAARANVLST